MLGQYVDLDGRRLGYFAGSIAAAALVVTGIYWALFGMNQWTTKVQQGANLMMAAAPLPYGGQSFGNPGVGGQVYNGQAYQGQVPGVAGMTGGAGQYVCPTHGAVGLPVLDAAGTPHCPVCNQVMCFNRSTAGGTPAPMGLVAFGGG
jgi:hypothetical protein